MTHYLTENMKIARAYAKVCEGTNPDGTIDDRSRYHNLCTFMAKAIVSDVFWMLNSFRDGDGDSGVRRLTRRTDGEAEYHGELKWRSGNYAFDIEYSDELLSFEVEIEKTRGSELAFNRDIVGEVWFLVSKESEFHDRLVSELAAVIESRNALTLKRDDMDGYTSYVCTLNDTVSHDTSAQYGTSWPMKLSVTAARGYSHGASPIARDGIPASGSKPTVGMEKRDRGRSDSFRRNLVKPDLPQ